MKEPRVFRKGLYLGDFVGGVSNPEDMIEVPETLYANVQDSRILLFNRADEMYGPLIEGLGTKGPPRSEKLAFSLFHASGWVSSGNLVLYDYTADLEGWKSCNLIPSSLTRFRRPGAWMVFG